MHKISISALVLIFCLCLPVHGKAAQELQEIKNKEHISRMYDRAVEFFMRKVPEEFRYRLNNSYKYIDFIQAIFGEKGIPHEIAYLPFIESGFSPVSVGPGDAAGLWQFVKGTARQYGLRMDSYVDERKDPVKSTYAAAEYLGDLYAMFGKWDIVLAAYKTGEGTVKRSGVRKSTAKLPAAVNLYVAQVLAAFTMAQEPEKYGFSAIDDEERVQEDDYREITTNMSISLKKLAARYRTTVKALRELNPALLRDETPPYQYVIRIPARY